MPFTDGVRFAPATGFQSLKEIVAPPANSMPTASGPFAPWPKIPWSNKNFATNSIVVWYRNRNGLAQTKGYIHNTGANNITVRQSFITDTLGTFTKSTVLTPGSKLTLDPFDLSGLGGLGTGDFQVVDYRVDVSGTTIAWYLFFPKPNGVNRGSN